MRDEIAMKRESAKESYAVWIPEEILEAGYPPVYEVPFAELSDDIADALGYPEWCRTVRADPEVGWAQRITIDPEASNAERSVASEFRKYIPVALTVCDGTALWTVGHKDEPRGPDRFYLGARANFTNVERKLCAAGFRQCRELVRLFELLSGFREDYPPSGGHFNAPDDAYSWLTEDYIDGNFGDFSLGEEWNPCVKFFTSRGGDSLLVNRASACGWWPAGSDTPIETYANDLDTCLEKWIAYRWKARNWPKKRPREMLWPFDPYGLPPQR
jgi:hypothetical protein